MFLFEGSGATVGVPVEEGARVVTETAFDVTVACTLRLTNGVYRLESATHGAGYLAGEVEKRKRAGWREMVVDLPPGVRRRREFVPRCSSHQGT